MEKQIAISHTLGNTIAIILYTLSLVGTLFCWWQAKRLGDKYKGQKNQLKMLANSIAKRKSAGVSAHPNDAKGLAETQDAINAGYRDCFTMLLFIAVFILLAPITYVIDHNLISTVSVFINNLVDTVFIFIKNIWQ